MHTKELKTQLEALDPDEQRFVLAIGIVLDRLRRLPTEDSDVAFELLKDYGQAKTTDEKQAAHEGIMEILDAHPVKIAQMSLASDKDERPADLTTWIRWVGKKIHDYRKAAELTQAELEEKSGLPQSHISRIENGKHSPSRATLEKIASALDVPLKVFDPAVEEGNDD